MVLQQSGDIPQDNGTEVVEPKLTRKVARRGNRFLIAKLADNVAFSIIQESQKSEEASLGSGEAGKDSKQEGKGKRRSICCGKAARRGGDNSLAALVGLYG